VNWRRLRRGPKNRNRKKMKPMKTNKTKTHREESTYALLVRSEDKKRGWMEIVVYGLAAISAVAMILAFANEFFWFPA
jgi:hypothetical protein